ncbi:hypothetical protein D1970_19250 [Mesobacillus zeae]|uniref:Uncharacterized protein n=1 Tax=Mesobacillus zeae TaxID=1917180 RepID=A0A398AXD3_9BACI|nr:hypothetical protein D1970_19250 [Mesobacillus zeae]
MQWVLILVATGVFAIVLSFVVAEQGFLLQGLNFTFFPLKENWVMVEVQTQEEKIKRELEPI